MDVEVGEALGSRWENSYLIFAETYDDAPAPQFPGGFAYGARWGLHGGVGVVSVWVLRDEFATTIEGQLAYLFDDAIEGA